MAHPAACAEVAYFACPRLQGAAQGVANPVAAVPLFLSLACQPSRNAEVAEPSRADRRAASHSGTKVLVRAGARFLWTSPPAASPGRTVSEVERCRETGHVCVRKCADGLGGVVSFVSFAYRLIDERCYPGCVIEVGTNVSLDVRKKVLRSRNRFWSPDDFDGSPDAVAQALSRLLRAGELRRIRRGLYWRGTPTRLGMAPPPVERVAHAVADARGTGPAGFSAALALGLSTQVPRRETIAVPGRAPRNLGSVRFVSRAASAKRRDERLRPAEVALLEVLRDWDSVVELSADAAVDRIGRLASSGDLRVDRLARASSTEPPHVRDRLRRLLTELGCQDAASMVRPARSRSVPDLATAG
jgi:hypothetical protein